MQSFCQWVLVGLLFIGFTEGVRKSFEGERASDPGGMPSFLTFMFVHALAILVIYGAGAMDHLAFWRDQ